MLSMRVERKVLLSTILSAVMVLGCGSSPDDERMSAIEVIQNTTFPPCGQEMPFSLALTGTYDGVPLNETHLAYPNLSALYPSELDILWGTIDDVFLRFIALNVNSEVLKGSAYYDTVGTLMLEMDRSSLDSILEGSAVFLDANLLDVNNAKFHIYTVKGDIVGVLCDNQ